MFLFLTSALLSYSGLYFLAFRLNIHSECGYSVRTRENTNQNNSEHGHFSRSVGLLSVLRVLFE